MIKEQQAQLAQHGQQQAKHMQNSRATTRAEPPWAPTPAASARATTPKELQEAEASLDLLKANVLLHSWLLYSWPMHLSLCA